jgi:hypothetical protein
VYIRENGDLKIKMLSVGLDVHPLQSSSASSSSTGSAGAGVTSGSGSAETRAGMRAGGAGNSDIGTTGNDSAPANTSSTHNPRGGGAETTPGAEGSRCGCRSRGVASQASLQCAAPAEAELFLTNTIGRMAASSTTPSKAKQSA